MAEMTIACPRQPGMLPWLLALALTLALVAGAVAISAHAIERHGSEAEMAHRCLDRPDYVLYNPETGRTAYVCMTEVGKWGIAILDRLDREVTAFLKNKMGSAQQVLRYLENVGYVLN